MRFTTAIKATSVATALVLAGASMAQAQTRVELGTSLFGVTIGLNDEQEAIFATGSGLFGGFNPGVYAAFFVGNRVAVEPQVSFLGAIFEDESFHALSLNGQFDFFFSDTAKPSAYLFAAVGIFDVTDEDYTPKTFGFGAGYRIPVGDRLVFRVDGRFVHTTSEFEGSESNALAFTFAIGGLVGR